MTVPSTSWRRRLNRLAAPISSILGILIIYGGVTLIGSGTTQLTVVTLGILVIEAGVYYMANPIITSERRYSGLRDEVDVFIDLVRRLNRLAAKNSTKEDLEQVQDSMRESVDRMGALARHPHARPDKAAKLKLSASSGV